MIWWPLAGPRPGQAPRCLRPSTRPADGSSCCRLAGWPPRAPSAPHGVRAPGLVAVPVRGAPWAGPQGRGLSVSPQVRRVPACVCTGTPSPAWVCVPALGAIALSGVRLSSASLRVPSARSDLRFGLGCGLRAGLLELLRPKQAAAGAGLPVGPCAVPRVSARRPEPRAPRPPEFHVPRPSGKAVLPKPSDTGPGLAGTPGTGDPPL